MRIVAPSTSRRRDQAGATSAEFIGISVVVVAIIGVLLALATPVLGGSGGVVDRAFCQLASLVGGDGGCGSAKAQPKFVPTKCVTNRDDHTYGGSVTVLATVAADGGYELRRVLTRNPDGTVKESYEVRTKGKLGANYTLKGGATAEVDTGGSTKKAGGGVKINVGGDAAWGHSLTFDTREQAQAFIDKYGDNLGEFGGLPDGAPTPESTYFDLSGQVKASGELGPLDANGSGAVTLGAEQFKNGDTKVKVALTAKAAGDLGIPLPEQVLALQSSGDASLVVTADVTFDSTGQVVKVAGSVVGTVTGKVDIGANTKLVKDLPLDSRTTVKSLDLPPFLEGAEGGTQFQVNFSTDFRRDDGTVDTSAIQALSEGLQNFVTTGEGLSPDQVAALEDQLDHHSQITLDHYNVDKEETKFGGKVSFLAINIGGEVHHVAINSNLLGSYYYDPEQGTWQENTVCDR
ncbi:hypothetical protein GCM10009795_028790 [Nocardioides hankookensis]|uniref:DUF4333 domain-containing protein n=1 Tax=Nocardioides hankookensis TaxID=443157 RepID=A0ABW1LDY5_9ACTN